MAAFGHAVLHLSAAGFRPDGERQTVALAGGANPFSPKGAELHKRSKTKRGSERGCGSRGDGQAHMEKAEIDSGRGNAKSAITRTTEQQLSRLQLIAGNSCVANAGIEFALFPSG